MKQVLERREIARDVAARRLHVAAHADPEPVVLDVEEHRERERRRHRERRPEAVRRDRRFAAEHDGDRARPRARRRERRVIPDRLRPSRGRRVLRSDVARHGQHDRAVSVRQIADDADVAAVAESAGAPERTAERVLDGQAERQQQWPRAIVGARRVVRMVDERAENRLRDVVAARGELVQAPDARAARSSGSCWSSPRRRRGHARPARCRRSRANRDVNPARWRPPFSLWVRGLRSARKWKGSHVL